MDDIRYTEMIRLQQDVIDVYERKIVGAATNQEVLDRLEITIRYALDMFTGSLDSVAFQQALDLFNHSYDTMSVDGLKRLNEVIIPVAVVRNLMKCRSIIRPSGGLAYSEFSERFLPVLMARE